MNPGLSGMQAPRRFFRIWPESYVIARLRSAPQLPALDPAGPPVALLIGAGEVTLLAPESVVDTFGDLVESASRGWRALTLDAVFPLDTTGVLAAIGRVLAEVDVPVMALSSHATDHILVPGDRLGRAFAALSQVRLEKFLTGH